MIKLYAVEVPEICFDALFMPKIDNPAMKNLNLADVKLTTLKLEDDILLLIGADNYWKLVTGEHIRNTDKFTAINTKLGWTIRGLDNTPYCVNLNKVSVLNVTVFEITDEDLMRQSWDLESLCIMKIDKYRKINTQNFMETKVMFNGERYEVNLP